MSALLEAIQAALPEALAEVAADGIATVLVPVDEVTGAIEYARSELGFSRFVDLTAVDRLARQGRFELVYLLAAPADDARLRIKARTNGAAPSITPNIPAANWYEREIFDLFGITFDGHPELRRIMLPDDWVGHPLRRTEPLGAEPVDFTVTRSVYGSD